MSDFQTARFELLKARQERNDMENDVRRGLERTAQLDKEIEQAKRQDDADRLGILLGEKKDLSSAIDKAKETYFAQKETVFGNLHGLFEQFGKPQDLIKHWDDHTPVLMFPIRIETRFVQSVGSDTGANQGGTDLLIRIFPDEISVVQHEEILTEKEAAAGRLFWLETWKAANEAGRLGAWKALTNGYGSYRAAWIARKTKPENIYNIDQGLFTYPTDEALNALGITEAEKAAGKAYWRTIWIYENEAKSAEKARLTLENAVGTLRANDVAVASKPINWGEIASEMTPKEWFDEVSQVPEEATDTTTEAWRRAAYADVLPDKFVFIGYDSEQAVKENKPLFEEIGLPIPDRIVMSPDPKGLDSKIEKDDAGNLIFTGDMVWMKDFNEAVNKGLAKRIRLNTTLAQTNIYRLVVVGLNLVDEEQNSVKLLEKLFDNHHFASRGLSFLPQGTPTNNTEGVTSDYIGELTAEESFSLEMKNPLFTPQNNMPFYEKTDGQRTADALGITPSVFQHIRHADRTELREAQAMNVALWNTTLGYYMDEMLEPIAKRKDIQNTFDFFTRYVSARDSLPAIRVGRQPYGILTTTRFDAWQWTAPEIGEKRAFYLKLQEVIAAFSKHWEQMVAYVPSIKGGAQNTQLDEDFLKIVGLNPTSVAYANRFMWGLQMSRTLFQFYGGLDFFNAIFFQNKAEKLMLSLGFNIAPAAMNKQFWKKAFDIDNTKLIDTEPLSETNPIKPFFKDETTPANNQNYIHWLRTKSSKEIEQSVFKNEKNETVPAPNALLYNLLRHAVLQSFWDTAMKIYEDFKVVNWDARREIQLANIKPQTVSNATTNEAVTKRDFTKWDYLNAPVSENIPQLQATGKTTMAEYIGARVKTPIVRDSNLHLVNAALEKLENLPTARLERLMAEHLDLCSYRLDGWQNGLLQRRLEYLRYEHRTDNEERPINAPRRGINLAAYGWLENLKPLPQPRVVPPTDIPEEFQDRKTVFETPLSGGFIHAPSINHAITASLLRNGYLTHAKPDDKERLSINLSSDRVRRALFFMEGIRNGQEFGALLGYQLERSFHDDNIDTYIYRFRKKFPFKVNRKTSVESGQTLEVAVVQNVVDGYALMNDINQGATYPYGVEDLPLLGSDRDKIIKAVELLLDSMDAVGDLALSESVHQFVQGNQAKTGSTLKMVQEGHYPSIPDVVQTPRGGNAITQRVALNLDPSVLPPVLNATPRSIAEPALNKWLSDVIGGILSQTKVIVRAFDNDGFEEKTEISLSALNLQPIDIVFFIGNQIKDLEKRLFFEYRKLNPAIPTNAFFEVMYKEGIMMPPGFSLAEVMPLLKTINNILSKARPANAADFRLPSESKPNDKLNIGNINVGQLRSRVDALLLDFKTKLLDPLSIFYQKIETELTRTDNNDAAKLTFIKAAFINSANGWEDKFKAASLYDVPDAFPSAVINFGDPNVPIVVDDDFAKTDKVVEELQKMFSKQFFGSPNNRFTLTYLANIVSLKTVLEKKHKAATDKLDKIKPETSINDTVPLLMDAAKILLGSSAMIIPHFSFENAPELQAALSQKSDLWTFKKEQLQTALPDLTDTTCEEMILEEWLQGIARVRVPVGHVEKLKMFSDTLLETSATSLTPIQLPYLGQKYWVALDIPETAIDADGNPKPVLIDRDYLSLIMMNLPAASDFSQPQAALMIDDWTESVPNKTETTGITVNYNQPNSEPPQCLLLAISPTLQGAWTWNNLVGIVNDTLNRAKQRAVEPDIIAEKSGLSQLLPAVTTVHSNEKINISVRYAGAYKAIAKK
jgi:hypothetical protein